MSSSQFPMIPGAPDGRASAGSSPPPSGPSPSPSPPPSVTAWGGAVALAFILLLAVVAVPAVRAYLYGTPEQIVRAGHLLIGVGVGAVAIAMPSRLDDVLRLLPWHRR